MVKVGDILQQSSMKALVVYTNEPFFKVIYISPEHHSYRKTSEAINYWTAQKYVHVIGKLKLAELLYG